MTSTGIATGLTGCGGASSDTPTTPPGGASTQLDHVTVTGVPSAATAGDTIALSATATTGSGATAPDVSLSWQFADTSAATFLTASGSSATLTTGNAATASVRLRKAGSVVVTVTATTSGIGGAPASASSTATFTVAAPRVAPALVRLALSPRTAAARYGVFTAVTATVTDALGNGADVPVTWTPIPHDGERFAGTAPVRVTVPTVPVGVSPAPTRTAQVMGVYPTTTRVVASAQPSAGGQAVSDTLTLRVLDRPAAGLTAAMWASAMLPGATQAVTVAATDSAGRATTAPDGLTYASSNPAVATVDATGQVTAVGAGQVTITVTAPPGQTVYGSQPLQTTTALTVVPTAPFAIDVRFVGPGASGTYAAQVQRAAARAVDRWRTLVTQGGSATPVSLVAGACGDASPAIDETVPSLLVFVELTASGGTTGVPTFAAAVGGPCVVRSGAAGLPVVGQILVDTTKLAGQSDDGVATVITHELGHVLGFGTLWNGPRAAALVTGTGTADPRYVGANGAAAWQAASGARVGGGVADAGVPLEAVAAGGLVAHWRTTAFGNELMLVAVESPSARAPVSAVTLGVLADFGYGVAPADADPYQMPRTAAANRATAGRDTPLEDDVLVARLAVAAGGRVHPLTASDLPGRIAVPRLYPPADVPRSRVPRRR